MRFWVLTWNQRASLAGCRVAPTLDGTSRSAPQTMALGSCSQWPHSTCSLFTQLQNLAPSAVTQSLPVLRDPSALLQVPSSLSLRGPQGQRPCQRESPPPPG